MEHGWLSALPPLIAIFLAIATRQVFLSLFTGILAGWIIISEWNIFFGITQSIQSIINVFKDEGNTRVIIFSCLVGALITLTQGNGGVTGFISLIQKSRFAASRRGASILSFFVGCSVFIESSISCLVTGAVSHPVFEKLKISREKLAYFCDTTSSPVCILIPLNAWGAYVISLLEKEKLESSISVFLNTIPLNFYAISSVLFAGMIAFGMRDFGPMAKAESRAAVEGKTIADNAQPVISEEVLHTNSKKGIKARALNFIIPVVVMIIMMPLSLLITGKGDITSGSGSTAVLWSVISAVFSAALLSLGQRILKLSEVTDLVIKGMAGLIPLSILMTLAFAIGDTCRELETGIYIASISENLISKQMLAPVVFLTSCVIAFSTGTSWGTFAIMIPIAVPSAQALGADLSLAVASVLSGSVFGDHCSPLSDTTIVSSMASASDHIDHVRTQLPYASVCALVALVLFYFAGFVT